MIRTGRVAVVTGGGMGIGAEIVKLLARTGARVAITDVNTGAGAEVVASIVRDHGDAAFFEHDVASSPRPALP